jgi:hypothetical protein
VAVRVVPVGARAVVAAHPLEDHPPREQQDHHPHRALGGELEPRRQLRLEGDHRQPDEQQAEGMAQPPPRAEPGGAAAVSPVGRDERGHGHEVVRVRGVAQAQDERDPERDQQRRALEQAREPLVGALERAEQPVEAHAASAPLTAATAAWP